MEAVNEVFLAAGAHLTDYEGVREAGQLNTVQNFQHRLRDTPLVLPDLSLLVPVHPYKVSSMVQ